MVDEKALQGDLEKNPQVLFCAYCKSGTTIITKTYAHCVGLPWQNEVRSLWGITKLVADINGEPGDYSVADKLKQSGKWTESLSCIQKAPVLKFPEGILILDLFPEDTSVICVVRHPLDTVCSYLERKYEFKKLHFSKEELIAVAQEWNYYILSVKQSKKHPLLVSYEDFVANPERQIKEMAKFVGHHIYNPVPSWVTEQAQKYYKFVPQGQPIRGLGRYKLSIQDETVIQRVLEVCQPALSFLKDNDITFADLRIK